MAEAAGVNPSAIRYYERKGIPPDPVRLGGQRRSESDILHLPSVLDVATQAGFSLDEIRLLFEATDGGAPAHVQLKELSERKLPQLEALIARAKEVRGWLESASGRSCGTLGECSLFDGGLPGAADAPDCV